MKSERDLIVPLVDADRAGRIYDRSIHRLASLAGLAGTLVGGWLGWAVASGAVPVAGLGQWAAAGPALGAVTGAGLGLAAGGLAGAVVALQRLPRRRPPAAGPRSTGEHEQHGS